MKPVDEPADIPHRSRKKHGKWCKGKEGVLHDYHWVDDRTLPNAHAYEAHFRYGDGRKKPAYYWERWYTSERQICTVCSKQKGYRRRCNKCREVIQKWGWWQKCPLCGYEGVASPDRT